MIEYPYKKVCKEFLKYSYIYGDRDMPESKRNKIPELVKKLYEIVSELEGLYPGRKFTPDGHMVGSIGEVIAAHDYDLELLDASNETHDAKQGTKQIQIKATQGKSVSMY